jgi:hypothetical protein
MPTHPVLAQAAHDLMASPGQAHQWVNAGLLELTPESIAAFAKARLQAGYAARIATR